MTAKDTNRVNHKAVAKATKEAVEKLEQKRRENPEGKQRDHHKFGHGWHGPSVMQCPECGTKTRRKNVRGKGSIKRAYVCPHCYPVRKRVGRSIKRLLGL